MTKKQVIIGIIILLVVGVAGFVGYKLYLNKKAKNEQKDSTVEEPKPQVLPQAKLEGLEIKVKNLDKTKIQLLHDAVAK